MIIPCTPADEERLFSYIGDDYPACLYLYLDLKQYGLRSDRIEAYRQQDGERITAILLKYYSCLHVYSADQSFDAGELAAFFAEKGCAMLYCRSETAQKLRNAFPLPLQKRAVITDGWVARIRRVDREAQGLAVAAAEEDFDQIVRLIYEDEEIGRSYRYAELAEQLRERSREGFSRSLVIKNGDLVIAHACTNAERDGLAVVAELLVRKAYRRRGYASEIWRELCGRLLSEGKEVYSFYYSAESRALHRRIGFEEICLWTKIVIR